VTPDAPHRRADRADLDVGSYGIVKPICAARDRPTRRWHREPEAAFHVLAREFAAAA
jgi:hypothetical protein